MKKYCTYRDIRKRALVMGLPLSSLAIMMISIVGSLLFIIFSFSLIAVLSAFAINASLFMGLSYMVSNPGLFIFSNPFPKIITNKKDNLLHYENS